MPSSQLPKSRARGNITPRYLRERPRLGTYEFQSLAVPRYIEGETQGVLQPNAVLRELLDRGMQLIAADPPKEFVAMAPSKRLHYFREAIQFVLRKMRWNSRKETYSYIDLLLHQPGKGSTKRSRRLPGQLAKLAVLYIDEVCADLEGKSVTYETIVSLRNAAEAILQSATRVVPGMENFRHAQEVTRLVLVRTESAQSLSAAASKAVSERKKRVAAAGGQAKSDKYDKVATQKIIEIYLAMPKAHELKPIDAANKIRDKVQAACREIYKGTKREGKSPVVRTIKKKIEEYRSAK